MFIINQDHDEVHKYERKLRTKAHWYKDAYMGVNLYDDDVFLGTFDDPDEALAEIAYIKECKEYFYTVKGYSDDKND